MMNDDLLLSRRVLDQIARENIQPKSRMYFFLEALKTWFLVLISIFIGGHSLGILIYFASHLDFALLPLFLKTDEKVLLLFSVLVWFVGLVLGSVFGYRRYRKTKKGYRIESFNLILLVIVGVFGVGLLSYKTEATVYFEQKLHKYLPVYQPWESLKIRVWSRPEEGLLAGSILKIVDEKNIEMRDFKGEVWRLDLSQSLIRKRVSLEEGVLVKVIGELKQNDFLVKEVRPWMGRRGKGRCFYQQNKVDCLKNNY
ncbi:MAG: hypothetical protein KDD61_03965 [Bdellovibrionales bacterium]|nr:hypothetical protein [Bdellovibrionales bacterium]